MTPAVADHAGELSAAQGTETGFVWGRDRRDGALWKLEDNQAAEHRAHVKEHVVCPVTGCAAALTTVHNSHRRDHLRHLRPGGGHSAESIFHAQACALVEHWLTVTYPRSTVAREVTLGADRERRADVLITGPQGARVAVEVQYSPLTNEAWRARHESYRRLGVVDVWLFGHTGSQMKRRSNGTLQASVLQCEIAGTAAPLMFIDPVAETIQFAVQRRIIGLGDGLDWTERTVDVFGSADEALLRAQPLVAFRVDQVHGFSSDWVDTVRRSSESTVREEPSLGERRRQQEQIRDALTLDTDWQVWKGVGSGLQPGPAQAAIRAYFRDAIGSRIDSAWNRPYIGQMRSPLTRWQCLLYFRFIAGVESSFTTEEAVASLQGRNAGLDEEVVEPTVKRWLGSLARSGFLTRGAGNENNPWTPTEEGRWK